MRDFLIGLGVIVGWIIFGIACIFVAFCIADIVNNHVDKGNPIAGFVFFGLLGIPFTVWICSVEITRLGVRTRMRFSK